MDFLISLLARSGTEPHPFPLDVPVERQKAGVVVETISVPDDRCDDDAVFREHISP